MVNVAAAAPVSDIAAQQCVALIDVIAVAHRTGDKSKARSALGTWAENCKDMAQHAELLLQLRNFVDPPVAGMTGAPSEPAPQLLARRSGGGTAALTQGLDKAKRGEVGISAEFQGEIGSTSAGADQFFKLIGTVAQAYVESKRGGSGLGAFALSSVGSSPSYGSSVDTAAAGATLEPATGVGSGGCDAEISAIDRQVGAATARSPDSTGKLEAVWWGLERMIQVIDKQCPGDPVKVRQRAAFAQSLAGVKQTCAQISSAACAPRLR